MVFAPSPEKPKLLDKIAILAAQLQQVSGKEVGLSLYDGSRSRISQLKLPSNVPATSISKEVVAAELLRNIRELNENGAGHFRISGMTLGSSIRNINIPPLPDKLEGLHRENKYNAFWSNPSGDKDEWGLVQLVESELQLPQDTLRRELDKERLQPLQTALDHLRSISNVTIRIYENHSPSKPLISTNNTRFNTEKVSDAALKRAVAQVVNAVMAINALSKEQSPFTISTLSVGWGSLTEYSIENSDNKDAVINQITSQITQAMRRPVPTSEDVVEHQREELPEQPKHPEAHSPAGSLKSRVAQAERQQTKEIKKLTEQTALMERTLNNVGTKLARVAEDTLQHLPFCLAEAGDDAGLREMIVDGYKAMLYNLRVLYVPEDAALEENPNVIARILEENGFGNVINGLREKSDQLLGDFSEARDLDACYEALLPKETHAISTAQTQDETDGNQSILNNQTAQLVQLRKKLEELHTHADHMRGKALEMVGGTLEYLPAMLANAANENEAKALLMDHAHLLEAVQSLYGDALRGESSATDMGDIKDLTSFLRNILQDKQGEYPAQAAALHVIYDALEQGEAITEASIRAAYSTAQGSEPEPPAAPVGQIAAGDTTVVDGLMPPRRNEVGH